MRKNTLAKIFLILICAVFVTGCGGDNEVRNVDPNNPNQIPFDLNFQILTSPGYYGDIRMQPNGVFLVRNKLTEDQVNNYGVVYNVEFNEENKLNKITAMQGGIPIAVDWQDTLNRKYKFSAVTIEYSNTQVRYNFRSSRMAAVPGFYDAYSIGYKIAEGKKNTPVAYLYDKEGNQLGAWHGYAQMFFSYDQDKLSRIVFADDGGSRVTTNNNEYEIKLNYGKKFGFPSEIANYAKDGTLQVDNSGIAKTTFKLDDKNRVIEIRHYGSDETLKDKNSPNLAFDKVITSTSAGAITRYSYSDNTDRVTKIAFLGKDEQAEGIKAWGNIATVTLKYTPEGWISEVASFATDDSPIALAKNYFGDNVVKIEMAYDEFGNRSKMIFYGKDDNVVTASKLGAAEIRYKHDEKRRNTGSEYYGTGGDKIEINDTGFNYHGTTFEYDDDDDINLIIYYNKDSQEVQRREIPKKDITISQNVPQKTAVNTVANATPAAAPAPRTPNASDSLIAFHRNITAKDYWRAYNYFSVDFQNAVGSYDGWANGFRTTVSSSVSDISVEYSDSYMTTLTYILTAVDNPGGTRKFRGTATLIKENGEWKIDAIKNKVI